MCIATSQLEQPLMPIRARHVSAPAASTSLNPEASFSASHLSWKSWKCRLLSRIPDHQQRTFCRLRHRSLEEGDLPRTVLSLNSTPYDHPDPSKCSVTTTCPPRSPVSDEDAHENDDEVNSSVMIHMTNLSLPLKSLPGRIVVDESPPHRWPSDDPGGGPGQFNKFSSTGCHRRPAPHGLHSVLLRQELFLVLVSLSLLLTGFAQPVQGEICSSMIIKHNVNKFRNLTNCSIIEGHLIIASMNENELMNYTFPMLREVTDYVIFYQAQNIAKLDHIFPNLAVIRGNKLVMDFALVIYQMDRMAEIGLTGLTHILRGGVRVEKNRNLCYVNTVNWKRIVSPAYYQDIHIEENEMVNMCPLSCPKHCPSLGDFYGSKKAVRNCWSSTTCQIDPNNLRIQTEGSTAIGVDQGKCDDACIGGCTGETQLDCYACRDVMDVMSEQHEQKKNCISTCPDSLLLYENWRCISTEKCSEKKTRFNAETIGMERSYKNYKGKCLEHCPPDTEEEIIESQNISTCKKCDDCAKECPGQTIRSLETLKKFQGCTKIMGDLTIQITGKNIVDELGKNLDKVSVITGSLKISRSFPIVSLDFFKNLKEIQGAITPDTNLATKTHYSLEILENENLQKLFPANSNVRITFRNGPDGIAKPGKAFIHYNQKLCRTEIKKLLRDSQMHDPGDKSPDISYGTNGHKSVCSEKVLKLRIENWAAGQGLQLNFDNYQEEIARSNPKADTRALLNYEIHYREIDLAHFEARNVTKFEGRDACGNDKWMIDDHWPTPANIHTNEYNEIVQEWPPETSIITDGIKPYSYYAIFVTTLIIREGIKGGEDIKSAASEIVYFHTPEDTPDPPQNIKVKDLTYSKVNITWQPPENPNGVITEYKVEVIYHQANTERLINIGYKCDDDYQRHTDEIEKPKEPKPKPRDEQSGTCDCSTCGSQGSEKKDQISLENEKVEEAEFLDHLLNLIYYIDFPTRKKRSISNMTNLININDVNENNDFKFDIDDLSDEEILSEERRMSSNVFDNSTDKLWIAIPDLKHFSKYTVIITACHRMESDGYQRCSKQQSQDFKTLKKEGADDIPGQIISNQDTNNGTDVWLSWEDPPDPNLVIVHYRLYIRMQDALTERPMTVCITAYDFLAMDRKYYPNFKGSFYASVSAVSLAGPGKKTPELAVSINERPSKLLLPILLPLVVALIIAAGVGYVYFKKQRAMGDETTCNPIYLNRNFGNFEIPRDLIKVAQKLGTGSFGTVYGGVYTHEENGEVPCAIKEAKNDALREQLLDEAYLMRCIDTPHVVKLLGVVTEGFPQYVILELMENGDLKNYLRKRRPNPPSHREVYQMAIQVADGMAYLSNVPEPKIIHRDLAARNCMVNGKLVVKIGDFGLARDLCYAQDYYRMHGKDWMPVRWMAPESLVDNVFSYASDVWAYGVVLWELVTLAQQPYQGMSNEEVLNFVKNGNTEKVPSGTPEIIANLMRDCWRFEASDRPTFIDICHRLLEHSHQEFQRDSFITSALCRRVMHQREGILASGDDDLPIDEAELAPLQSNGNGEVRALDNGNAVQFPVKPEDTLRDFNNSQINPRAHNMLERLRKILRNRLPHSNTTTAASTSAAASATAVEA